MLLAMLSDSARERHMPPLWGRPLHAGGQDEESLAQDRDAWFGVSEPMESLVSIGKAASGFLSNALKRNTQGSFLMPAGTPRSTLNRHINAQRRFATQQF